MTEEREIFIPTYELVLCQRNYKGEPTGKKSRYVATTGRGLAGHMQNHMKKFPRKKKKKPPTGGVDS